jgi:hypothetical protein
METDISSFDEKVENIQLGWTFNAQINIENRKESPVFKVPAKPVASTAKEPAKETGRSAPKDPLKETIQALSDPKKLQEIKDALFNKPNVDSNPKPQAQKRKPEEKKDDTKEEGELAPEAKKQKGEHSTENKVTPEVKKQKGFAENKKISALGYEAADLKGTENMQWIDYVQC